MPEPTHNDIMDKLDVLDSKLDSLEVKLESEWELWKRCTNCKGTGIDPVSPLMGSPPIPNPCTACNGLGRTWWGYKKSL